MSYSHEWCTKKQASKLIGRTERTVSRVVRDAVENRAEDILANLKLVYASGHEIPGAEVTRDLLSNNEKEGSRTRWFFRTVWWRDDYAPRNNIDEAADSEPPKEGIADGGQSEKRGSGQHSIPGKPPALPVDPTTRAVVLEHLHYSDQKHAAELRELTDRVLQVVETNQQLQGQSNTLYNQFQDTLKLGGGLRALVETASQSPAARPGPVTPLDASEAIVVDLEAQAAPQVSSTKKPQQSKPVATQAAATAKTSKRQKKEGTVLRETSFAARHLPTLSRLFTRRSK